MLNRQYNPIRPKTEVIMSGKGGRGEEEHREMVLNKGNGCGKRDGVFAPTV